jgi:polysaccharide export outer membrane protein
MIRRLTFVLGVVALALSAAVRAQLPTPDQIELLRTMSPEDREALMQDLGLDAPTGGDSTSATGRGSRNNGDAQRRTELNELRELDQREITFKPEDSLLIEIDFKKDRPPRVESQGAGLPPITIPGELAPVLTEEERDRFRALMTLIRSKNPYQLDTTGALLLPGFNPIMLAGLNTEQASQRMSAEPALYKLDVKVVRLPVRKVGAQGLKPFGYDLFKDATTTFAPIDAVPVPSNYVIGPGDILQVQLYGSNNRNLRLPVGRDGRINFPELGPIAVAGRTFEEVSKDLEARVVREMIGVRASVGMGGTRSIQVFVMGEANRPGSYTVSGLATVTSALYAAGGVRPIGSLRDIQLKRQGAVIRRFDLYDLLLRGDTSDDAKLLPGDVIFIPAVGATVAIDGEVQRPAIYELKGSTTVDDVVRMAGGLTNQADRGRAALVRVDESRARVVLDVPLDESSGRDMMLRAGDSLRVLSLRPTLDQGVVLEGHVFQPGFVAWHKGMRLTEVIASVDELKPNADIGYLLVRREVPPDRRITAISADLGAALRDPASAENIVLEPRDRIMVFDVESGRQRLIEPLLEDMRRQASLARPNEVVRVEGRVKAIGEYPLEPGMRVSDLIRAGGGLQAAAYGGKAELIRYGLQDDARRTQLLEVDLAAILRGDEAADIQLWPFDLLNVKEVPEWSEQERMTLLGEVRFPGTYSIQRGESLRSVLARAGGLTSLAFKEGTVFTRVELREREQAQIDQLARRLQSDLASAALQATAANQGGAGQALAVGQSLLNQLKQTQAVGRLVIDIDAALAAAPGSNMDVALRDGDRLIIPKLKQEVTVIGEVQTTTSHFYRDSLSRDDYISLSGGLTSKADRGRIYVVRADGSVISSEGAGWFRRSAQVQIRPGDTIVVPLDTERMPALPLWQAVTSIVYNLAIAAAAVNSF